MNIGAEGVIRLALLAIELPWFRHHDIDVSKPARDPNTDARTFTVTLTPRTRSRG